MKNVLIYIYRSQLAPTGGPLGYNYFLKQQLDKMSVKNIRFLPGKENVRDSVSKKVKGMKTGPLKTILTITKGLYSKYKTLYGFSHKAVVDLNEYDIVHFHSTRDMYDVRDSLLEYHGSVVLTSHSPKPLSQEIYDNLTDWEKKHMNWFYKDLIKIDEYAFNRADYIFFPCEEAEEPYYNNWPEFNKIKINKKEAFRYLLTGTKERKAQIDGKEVRKKYSIPDEAFVICYVGRHNATKGYDNLRIIGEKYLDEHKDAYFLIAGKEEPLQGISNSRWIEVGWTSDPHSLIAASDVFILPNKETYFDLVLLEVLSLGKIVIASKTGGNKYFKKINAKGIMVYNTIEEAAFLLDKVKLMNADLIKELEEENKKIFMDRFSLKVFAEKYISLINNLN